MPRLEAMHHLPYKYIFLTDLGGTSFDFTRQVSVNNVEFCIRNEVGELTKVTLPGEDSFISVSLQDLASQEFLQLSYNYDGSLSLARLWFRRFIDQASFFNQVNPSKLIVASYDDLVDTETELVLEANLKSKNFCVYHCPEVKWGGLSKIISFWEGSMVDGDPAALLDITPNGQDDIIPVRFAVTLEDGAISLGFCPNHEDVVREEFSTDVGHITVANDSSPREIKEFLNKVFLTDLED